MLPASWILTCNSPDPVKQILVSISNYLWMCLSEHTLSGTSLLEAARHTTVTLYV